jgi:hypothetical protein
MVRYGGTAIRNHRSLSPEERCDTHAQRNGRHLHKAPHAPRRSGTGGASRLARVPPAGLFQLLNRGTKSWTRPADLQAADETEGRWTPPALTKCTVELSHWESCDTMSSSSGMPVSC